MRTVHLILGVTGQDGYYLSKRLIKRGHYVVGTSRDPSSAPLHTASLLSKNFQIVRCRLENFHETMEMFLKIKPSYVYNLAAQSSVAMSFEAPGLSLQSILRPVVNSLEALRIHAPKARYFHASSSEVFGSMGDKINSNSAHAPQSPYAMAKSSASKIVNMYRDVYGLFAINGYMFNHESIYRNSNFVTQKVLDYVVSLRKNKVTKKLQIGNIDVIRDWGLAKEYVGAVHDLLLTKAPQDCVICSGHTMTLRSFIDYAFQSINVDYREYIQIEEFLKRERDIDCNSGDASEAKELINWKATTFGQDLVTRLINEKLSNFRYE